MKTGKTLTELAQELERIQSTKKDFIAPVAKMRMDDAGKVILQNGQDHAFDLNNWSAGQVAGFADIPKSYFDRIRGENTKLLADNVNHAFSKLRDQKRLVRTLDGNVRGFLSNSYRMLDAHDLLEATLPVLLNNRFEPISTEITEKRLYLKCATARIQGEVQKGDVVQYGVMLSTSDVGAGALRVEPFFYRLACLNGAIMETKFRKAHLGSRREEKDVFEIMSDKTKALNDMAFYATVKDYLLSTMRPDVFQAEIEKMRQSTQDKITNFDLEEVVELAMDYTKTSGEHVKQSVLKALASGNEGAGLTRWGLVNSFTRAAQDDQFDYDTATDLERAGGSILELDQSQWKRIAEVA